MARPRRSPGASAPARRRSKACPTSPATASSIGATCRRWRWPKAWTWCAARTRSRCACRATWRRRRCRSRRIDSPLARPPVDEGLELVDRQRLAEQETLVLVAAFLGQEGALFGCLHAFGDDTQAEAARQVDDGARDRGVVRVREDVAHELLVDLQLV